MADFARIATVTEVASHPNADKLEVLRVEGYQICAQRGTFQPGDMCVLVPPDSIMPDGTRIKKCKLRGVLSEAMVLTYLGADPVGTNVSEPLGITRYSPDLDLVIGSDQEKCEFDFPRYVDIESILRGANKYQLEPGEQVVLTEKIHGSNGRFVFRDGRLWVGGRNQVLKENPDNVYWRAGIKAGLPEKLAQAENIVLFGEVYGRVQVLRYGSDKDVSFVAFDAYDLSTRRWLDVQPFTDLCARLQIPTVPTLYVGGWDPALYGERNGPSVLAAAAGAAHVREGFVVRPLIDRNDQRGNRVIYKYVGEDYENAT